MKILYIGNVTFSARCLEKILEPELRAELVGVCAGTDSGLNSDYEDLEPIATANNIAFLRTSDINSRDTVDWITALKPDIVFCFGWSRLLGKEILDLAPMGVLGFHPAALPKNRGRHPLIWSLVLGLEEIASTFFFMDGGADSGPILCQEPVAVGVDDDAMTLYRRVIDIAEGQIERFLPRLQSGAYSVARQDHSKANYWRKRSFSDGEIDWRMSSEAIFNLVRALTHPYLGAHFMSGDSQIKVWQCRSVNDSVSTADEPGKIIELGQGPIVKTGNGAVELIDYDPEIELSVGDYL